MAERFAGTQIAADGRRYDIDDPDAPTVAPPVAGKIITHAAMTDAIAVVTDDLGDLDELLERTVTDAVVLNADATVTSVAANFTDADIGALVVNAKFPEGTVIDTINAENSVELSEVATSAGTSQTLVIRRRLVPIEQDQEARIGALE